jgi:hypothetical protein
VPDTETLAVNIIGPDGQLVLAGEPVPEGWPDELAAELGAQGALGPPIAGAIDVTDANTEGAA